MPFAARIGFFARLIERVWQDLTRSEIESDIANWDHNGVTRTQSTVSIPTEVLNVNNAWRPGVGHPNGYIYYAPFNANRNKYLRYDTIDSVWTEFDTPTMSGSARYNTGTLGADDRIYFPPANMDKVLVIDPATETATLEDYGLTLTGSNKYLAAVTAGDLVVCAGSANHILIIDTSSNTATTQNYGLTSYFNNNTSTKTAAGARSVVNDYVYFVPYAGSVRQLLIYEPDSNTATTASYGRNWNFQETQGVGNGSDGHLYANGHNTSTAIKRIDVTAETVTAVGNSVKGYGAITGRDGNIYVLPDGAAGGAFYDVRANTITTNPTFISNAQGFRWNGSLMPDGKIYAMSENTSNRNLYVINTQGNDNDTSDLAPFTNYFNAR